MFNKKKSSKTENKEFNGAVSIDATPISYTAMRGKSLFVEGYMGNPTVYRCVKKTYDAINSIKIKVVNANDEEIEDQKATAIINLLNRPNPVNGASSFSNKIFLDFLILGEMFISANIVNGKPVELWDFPPLQMTVMPGNHIPRAYIHKINGSEVTFPVDKITGESDMFLFKGENPLNEWRGMSPLFAASLAADTNNAGLRWNHSLLKNGTRASGILNFIKKPAEDAMLRAKNWWKTVMQGESNAGEVGILWGDTKFQELGKSPKDMDFAKTLNMTTAFIATAYGVPLPLLMNDAATFNNMSEAKTMFYEDTVMPLYQTFLECFGNWLLPKFDMPEGSKLIMDVDSISALEPVRSKRRESMTKLVSGSILTPNEARGELNYDEIPGAADELYMGANNLPLTDVGDEDE